jgi:pSer/pThr/pTyr-binding forkhead associated (FHA) protein
MPVSETTYLALGGGLGSFVWVDYLRVCGVKADQIKVIGREQTPYGRFQRLCRYSQISDTERIRSDSGARPDNLWGWPGYAVEEIAGLLRQGKWGEAARIAWQIFSEPVLTHTYAPRANRVAAGMEREMKRIGWQRMVRQGEVHALRPTDDGRYVVLYTPMAGDDSQRPQLVIAPYLHLALGYPGITLTAEAQAYRHSYQDWQRVVQAYEDHEQVYEQLGQQGGMVMVRGRGIVASRVLQRLDEVRQSSSGKPIQVIHLVSAPLTEATVYGLARRQRHHHRHVQPFNWPKAALGGDLRFILEKATPAERQHLFQTWGGTTTSNRLDWQEVVERGLREGWYRLHFGQIEAIKPNGRHRLIIQIQDYAPPHPSHRLIADFVLDCTGLNVEVANHPVLADLSDCYGLAKNGSGRLVVTPDFEIEALRNGQGGRLFVAGIMAGGNAFAPVDGFLGLQVIAQRTVDTLIRDNAPGLHRLDGRQSLRQWWRWWQGMAP